MCGRYTLKTPPDQWGQLLLPIIDTMPADPSSGNSQAVTSPDPVSQKLPSQMLQSQDTGSQRPVWQPRYNIAPTQKVVAVTNLKSEGWRLDYFRWGLVPSWAAELSIGSRMINARAETVDEKRSFAGPLKQRRCIVIADGYYEWQKLSGGSKQPCWIAPNDEGIVLFAGLWESNKKATGTEVRTCTIITTDANEALREIHDRMPAILDERAANEWLDPECSVEDAKSLLKPSEKDLLGVTRVSTYVNNVRNQGADCIAPLDPEA